MKTFFLFLLVAITAGCSPSKKDSGSPSSQPIPHIGNRQQMGGTEVGNGSDEHGPAHGSAWFLGKDRTIRACLEISDDFGLDRKAAASSVRDAFSRWPKYIQDKHLLGRRDPLLTPAFQLDLSDQPCLGKEDLKLFLGTGNEQGLEQAKGAFERPLAFAKRTSYEVEKGWGRGFIWVRSSAAPITETSFPNWSLPYQLNTILLHEFGHVFGCEHVEDTIMDKSIAKILKQSYDNIKIGRDFDKIREETYQIDLVRVLTLCYDCVIHANNNDPIGARTVNGHELLIDKAHKNLGFACRVDDYSMIKDGFTIVCKNSIKTYRWKVKSSLGRELQMQSNQIFKAYRKDDSLKADGAYEYHLYGENWLGSVENEKGQSFNVRFMRSVGRGVENSFLVEILIRGERRVLFLGQSEGLD